ncbi:glutamate-5-semialdehyde dehydrogenase [Lapidilactobacillus luobeiensis]|uniref:glutamate-5-semialdehyde dehydrogenase n=1 Tax=Lapidilactobacillus luobeiensis TaxID=2950371 RepID=UPI0028529F14|nr:glutamate-5-semialdehyde dehydrogenase [Lapidilactobacillus luobeiensis]
MTTTKLNEVGQQAQIAAHQLALMATTQKNLALQALATQLLAEESEILAANQLDLATAKANGLRAVMLDRLQLTHARLATMAAGVQQVIQLPDPVGTVINGWQTANGLRIENVRVPLGVIGMIYEARPNVTVDAAALTLKSGNAVILRGGKEAIKTNIALAGALQRGLVAAGLPATAIQLITDTSHETAQALMTATEYVDVLIPRGSAQFIDFVKAHAQVPVIQTGAGNCHVYVDQSADLIMAREIIINAKTQRPSVCNAMEKLVVHQAVAAEFLPRLQQALAPYQVELRGDETALQILPTITPATAADWGTEYNDLILAIKVVPDLSAAIAHINRYSTGHSETIVTKDYQASERFQREIDAAVVYTNASTRFTDGFEFGFGAEIGISTQKLHARGPMGLTALTSNKYHIYGQGQIRE